MAKTELGCIVLQEKGHFAEFAAFIRQHGLESEDQDLILKLKSVLWAVVSCLVSSLLLHGTDTPPRAISVPLSVDYRSLKRRKSFLRLLILLSSRWCCLSEGMRFVQV